MIGQSVDSTIRAALESHLCALVLCSTGPVSDIAALPRGYRRASGSFIADGFVEGDTVCVRGFGGERHAVAAAVA
ncbi:MAG: hypothetical protein K2Q10_03965, partial [Rhodospirillales bacterium]|nr:hypothetical protein [Rhodospirillales bacterium]